MDEAELEVNTTHRYDHYCQESHPDGRRCSLYSPHHGKHKPKHGLEKYRWDADDIVLEHAALEFMQAGIRYGNRGHFNCDRQFLGLLSDRTEDEAFMQLAILIQKKFHEAGRELEVTVVDYSGRTTDLHPVGSFLISWRPSE